MSETTQQRIERIAEKYATKLNSGKWSERNRAFFIAALTAFAEEQDGILIKELHSQLECLRATINHQSDEVERLNHALGGALNTLSRIAKLTNASGHRLYEGGCAKEAEAAILRINAPSTGEKPE